MSSSQPHEDNVLPLLDFTGSSLVAVARLDNNSPAIATLLGILWWNCSWSCTLRAEEAASRPIDQQSLLCCEYLHLIEPGFEMSVKFVTWALNIILHLKFCTHKENCGCEQALRFVRDGLQLKIWHTNWSLYLKVCCDPVLTMWVHCSDTNENLVTSSPMATSYWTSA